jgi:serine/threonine protein kinase
LHEPTTSPEVLKGKVYGTQADIFSVGIILWEMWYARPGYTHKKTDESGHNVPIAKNFKKYRLLHGIFHIIPLISLRS